MTYRPCGPHEFAYIHTDIPAGMTIREWRAQRAGERRDAEEHQRAERRGRRALRRRKVARVIVSVLARAAKMWIVGGRGYARSAATSGTVPVTNIRSLL